MSARKTAVVICPGRGTYNAGEIGYLARHFPDPALLDRFDRLRADAGQESLGALDGADRFSHGRHGRGDNASALIFAASFGDFLSIDRDGIDIVAVTGNSMGWYSALACAGAVSPEAGFTIANTMGNLMQAALIGGQLVYPWIDEDWVPRLARKAALLALVADIAARRDHVLALSIDLGGLLVLAGNEAGLRAFEAAVDPVQGRFPMRLANHAAFHTALQVPVAERAGVALPANMLGQPRLPLIDGRGAIWWPHATDPDRLHAYTLNHQVTQPYGFTDAIRTAAHEFAPDLFIVTGPGTTLGGSVAQSLILANWRGMGSRADFQRLQGERAILIAMGMAEQRDLAIGMG